MLSYSLSVSLLFGFVFFKCKSVYFGLLISFKLNSGVPYNFKNASSNSNIMCSPYLGDTLKLIIERLLSVKQKWNSLRLEFQS